MAERAVSEFSGKRLLSKNLVEHAASEADAALLSRCFSGSKVLQISFGPSGTTPPDFNALAESAPWVHTTKLVVKPDQLIKRRGKGGLLLLNADWQGAIDWVRSKAGTDVTVDGVTGRLHTFLVEPFVPHAGQDEYYICVVSKREGEEILFTVEGGVEVGDVDAKAQKLFVPIGEEPTAEAITSSLLKAVPAASRKTALSAFIKALFRAFMACHYAYLEVNPLVVLSTSDTDPHSVSIVPLDMAAKLDEAAHFLCVPSKWGKDSELVSFPPPFGRQPEPEESYIHDLDGKTGASLKLTILNRKGRVWTMVAGGGASVVYAGE